LAVNVINFVDLNGIKIWL